MTPQEQIKELLAACEAAVRRIERLNIGTEELGTDPTLVQLKKAIRNAKKAWPKKKAGPKH
jgi:hypothetical protein